MQHNHSNQIKRLVPETNRDAQSILLASLGRVVPRVSSCRLSATLVGYASMPPLSPQPHTHACLVDKSKSKSIDQTMHVIDPRFPLLDRSTIHRRRSRSLPRRSKFCGSARGKRVPVPPADCLKLESGRHLPLQAVECWQASAPTLRQAGRIRRDRGPPEPGATESNPNIWPDPPRSTSSIYPPHRGLASIHSRRERVCALLLGVLAVAPRGRVKARRMAGHGRQPRLLLQLCCLVLLGAALVAGFQLAPPTRIASRRAGVRGTCNWDGGSDGMGLRVIASNSGAFAIAGRWSGTRHVSMGLYEARGPSLPRLKQSNPPRRPFNPP